MKVEESITAEILAYLPKLKENFINHYGETNEMEQRLIDFSFANYELYLHFRLNENNIPVESESLRSSLQENEHLQLIALSLYYNKMLQSIKSFSKAKQKILTDIFQYYRESMLHFDFQKKHYEQITSLLIENNKML